MTILRHILFFCTVSLITACHGIRAEEPSSGFVFLPPGHHFTPLRSNLQEPRIGVLKFLEASNMKVDIGNAIDVLGFHMNNVSLTVGIDFMAYAWTTGAQGLRLQVDALDGFFGGDLSGTVIVKENERLQFRLRILHQSAHMVDGHYLASSNSWIDHQQPIPYTRDFGELTLAHCIQPSWSSIRYYGGLSYATLVRPSMLKRYSLHGGFEIVFDKWIAPVGEKPINFFLAHHIAFAGAPSYTGTNELQSGVKFGAWSGKGISLYLEYYAGTHMFGEYFHQRLTTIGLGFTVDFL